jgi:hypothetical protein
MQSHFEDLLSSIVVTTDRVVGVADDHPRDTTRERPEAGGSAADYWSPLWHRDPTGQPVLCACLPLALRCVGYPVETSDGVPIGVVRAVAGPFLTVAMHAGGELQLDVSAIRSTTGGCIRLNRDAASTPAGMAPRSPKSALGNRTPYRVRADRRWR